MPLTDRENELYTLARAKISEGRLPDTQPPSVGARSGSGEKCDLCEGTIEREDIEYEFLVGMRFRFHMQCHEIWQLAAESIAPDKTLPGAGDR